MHHHLHHVQLLPVSIDDAWSFFCSPANLGAITPRYMSFHIVSGADKPMHEGQLITYKLKVRGIVYHWVTEITEVRDREKFVDEQKEGPFAYWRHEHSFKPTAHGVEMTDHLEYSVPFGPIGWLANRIFVGNEVKQVFQYRSQMLRSIFPPK